MNMSLLDVLSEKCGCFISELKYNKCCSENLKKLIDISYEEYSIEECNYSFTYIYNKQFNFQSYKEIRHYLSELCSIEEQKQNEY